MSHDEEEHEPNIRRSSNLSDEPPDRSRGRGQSRGIDIPITKAPAPMELTISFESSPELMVVRGKGSFTVTGCRERLEDIAAEKDPHCNVLFDGRGLNAAYMSPSNLIEIDSILRHHIFAFLFCKIGILVVDGRAHELAEQWCRLASAGNRFRIAVFTDEPAAMEWFAQA